MSGPSDEDMALVDECEQDNICNERRLCRLIREGLAREIGRKTRWMRLCRAPKWMPNHAALRKHGGK